MKLDIGFDSDRTSGRPHRFPNRPALALLLLALAHTPAEAQHDTGRDDNFTYGVGVATGFVVDSTRPWDPLAAAWGTTDNTGFTEAQLDAVSNPDKAVRTLVADIWYPVDERDARRAPVATWGDFRFGDYSAHLAAFNVFDGLYGPGNGAYTFALKRKSAVGLPVVGRRGKRFPLVIMLHGDGSTRDDASSMAEPLARNGYIVIAIDRTGNSFVTQPGLIPGGVHPDVPVDADGRYPRTHALIFENPPFSVPVRFNTDFKSAVEDVEAVLDAVKTGSLVPHELNTLLEHRVDLEYVGVQGCSLGSAQAQFAQSVIPEIDAWVSVCSNLGPDQTPLLGGFVPPEFAGSGPTFPCPPEDASCLSAAEAMFGRAFGNQPYTVDKPSLWFGGREDNIVFGVEASNFAAGGLIPFPEVDGERFPAHRQLFDNATGPVFYTMLERMDHVGYLTRPEMEVLRRMGVSKTERTGIDGEPYELQRTATIRNIRDFYLRTFYAAYLKGNEAKLQQLTRSRFEQFGLTLEMANVCESGDVDCP